MRALISVSNKEKLEEFAGALHDMNYEIISTGGTHRFLTGHGIPATKVEELTGFPEILNGRVKTLHPAIHGGIMAKSEEDLSGTGIEPIDVVVVNLYQFEKFSDAKEDDMIENIDIGGVALLRAAAKNYRRVLVVSSPEQYDEVITLLSSGAATEKVRRRYAMEAFALTASYDSMIYNALWRRFGEGMPGHLLIARKIQERMRYGENPHQEGAFYSRTLPYQQLNGKKLSFNNLYDMDSAFSLVQEFSEPAAVVVKHANPCGAAVGKSLKDAFMRAWDGDPISAYGSIVAFNTHVDAETAQEMKGKFVEVVVAPDYDSNALTILQKKRKLRVIKILPHTENYDVRGLSFGILAQTWNDKKLEDWKVVSKKEPTQEEIENMKFAWKIVKHVKSNAIVLVRDRMVVGVGAGQMSRVDSVKMAIMKAGERATGAVLASDAFFPFRDAIDEAARAGVSAIIQPGGSIRDSEVVDAVNEHGLSMIFTGFRVFRH